MDVSQALNIINDWKPNQVETLADTVTMRKRKLTLKSMVWLLVGMAIYNDKSMKDLVNQLDIVDRTGKAFVAPSALTQRHSIPSSKNGLLNGTQ
jgi:hypothetical protein